MILDEIAARTKKRMLERKLYMPLSVLVEKIERQMEQQADAGKTEILGEELPGMTGVQKDLSEAERMICPESGQIQESEGHPESEQVQKSGGEGRLESGQVQKSGGKICLGFEQSLRQPGLSFICEVKKASPSKGLIAENFPYLEIAKDYEAAGAAAVSCLTEPYYFQGKDEYLREIAQQVSIPVLRKDFTVDPYMIYEAKLLGASAVLLICAILTDEELVRYRELAENLGLSALVEAHDEEEVRRALAGGAKIVGVNNRDLRTFEVDIHNSIRLRSLVPDTCVFVSESGIRTEEDMRALYENGTDAVLIGETLMRASDKKALIARLRGAGSTS